MHRRLYKLLLIGDENTGKTTWVNKLETGHFERNYVPTIGVIVKSITINTNKGDITFNIWDCAGQEQYARQRETYYCLGSCAIIMYDLSIPHSQKFIHKYFKYLQWYNGAIPKIVVGNKSDISRTKPDHNDIIISTKDTVQIYKPLLVLAQILTQDFDLRLI